MMIIGILLIVIVAVIIAEYAHFKTFKVEPIYEITPLIQKELEPLKAPPRRVLRPVGEVEYTPEVSGYKVEVYKVFKLEARGEKTPEVIKYAIAAGILMIAFAISAAIMLYALH